MNDLIKRESATCVTEALKNADIKITLEQQPCAVTVLGICATYAFVSWVNKTMEEQKNEAA